MYVLQSEIFSLDIFRIKRLPDIRQNIAGNTCAVISYRKNNAAVPLHSGNFYMEKSGQRLNSMDI